MSDIGDNKILRIECRDRLGVLTDPTTIRVWVKRPSQAQGTEVVPVTQISVGIYEAVYTIVEKDDHWWRVETTGTVAGVEERKFTVNDRQVTHA